jgi:hypothetical protein
MKQRFQIPVNFLTVYELITIHYPATPPTFESFVSLVVKKYPVPDIMSDESCNLQEPESFFTTKIPH